MALISKKTIQEVNDRLDAVSIVGEYVRLENKGGRWWGKCPFHGGGQEKTASFKIDPDLKLYNCFGCHKGGSIINFVMEMENISFPEAIKSIAKKSGVEIIYDESYDSVKSEEDNTFKEQLYELYSRVTNTFQYYLKENPEGKGALNYILSRGFNMELIDSFKLGFAPNNRNFLHRFLKEKKGYSESFLEKSGLFSSNYKTISLFSGRLMFPITDRQGRIVAFGGRALPGVLQSDGKESPKYINSPETEIYKKRQTLYAIDLAKQEIRQTKTVYIVEGYIDVMAMHKAGFTNTVAPLGTAFTDEQAGWLRRFAEKAVLIFDNDEAGQKAAYSAILTCRKNGINCAVADIQTGLKNEIPETEAEKYKDVAEILQKFGDLLLKNVLKFIINDFEYLIGRGKLKFVADKGDVRGAVRFMFPFLEAIDSEVDRSDSITRIADIYKIERSAVDKDYLDWKKQEANAGGNYRKAEDSIQEQKQITQKLKIKRCADLSLLTIIAVNMEFYNEFRVEVEIKDIEDRAAKEIFIAMEECFIHDENGIDSLFSRIRNEELCNYITECGTSGEYKGEYARKLMEDGITKIKIKKKEKRLTEINAQMREIERKQEGFDKIDELLEEKKEIDVQIRILEKK